MKVLIAGGTGFIGSHIAQKLAQEGHSLTILSRKQQKPQHSIEYIQADVTDPHSLEKITDSYDVAILCVQFPNHPVENPQKGWTYEKVDGEGTENICRVLQNLKIGKIIYISGAGTGPGKTEPWFKAKLRAEAAVMAACRKNGGSFVIFRPSWVYGPGDQSMARFIAFAKKLPFMPVIGDGENRIAPLFIDDLVKCVAGAALQPSLQNQIIEIGGPKLMTMNQVQSAVLKALGKRKPLVHHPLWLMGLAGDLLSFLPRPPLSRKALNFITMDSHTQGAEAERLFGFKFLPLEEGLSRYEKYE